MNPIEKFAKKLPGGTMRSDAVSFAIVEIIFLGIVVVLAVVILAYQTSEPILTNIMQGFGVPQAQIQVQQNLGGNIYNFDTWLPIIFWFLMLAICLSTIWLNADPISWMVGILLIPFQFWIAAWISNISRMILTQAVLVNGVSHLPQSISILANLSTITLLFGVLYIICLSIRIWFYPQGGGQGRPANQRVV